MYHPVSTNCGEKAQIPGQKSESFGEASFRPYLIAIEICARKIRVFLRQMGSFLQLLQGDQDHFYAFQMAIALKWCTSDPKLVKPKCV